MPKLKTPETAYGLKTYKEYITWCNKELQKIRKFKKQQRKGK